MKVKSLTFNEYHSDGVDPELETKTCRAVFRFERDGTFFELKLSWLGLQSTREIDARIRWQLSRAEIVGSTEDGHGTRDAGNGIACALEVADALRFIKEACGDDESPHAVARAVSALWADADIRYITHASGYRA